jgi:hypothetical protein
MLFWELRGCIPSELNLTRLVWGTFDASYETPHQGPLQGKMLRLASGWATRTHSVFPMHAKRSLCLSVVRVTFRKAALTKKAVAMLSRCGCAWIA